MGIKESGLFRLDYFSISSLAFKSLTIFLWIWEEFFGGVLAVTGELSFIALLIKTSFELLGIWCYFDTLKISFLKNEGLWGLVSITEVFGWLVLESILIVFFNSYNNFSYKEVTAFLGMGCSLLTIFTGEDK